ncbi:MAG: ferritin-like domain-containing protein [Bacteroidota bacterium]
MQLSNNTGGLGPMDSEILSEKLDVLLADYQVYQQNIRKLNWNPSIRPFFTLSESIEELQDAVFSHSEVIADKILMLGSTPSTVDGNYLIKASLTIVEPEIGYDEALKMIVLNSQQLLKTVREVYQVAEGLGEKFTMALMSQLARSLGGTIWHFSHLRMAHMN